MCKLNEFNYGNGKGCFIAYHDDLMGTDLSHRWYLDENDKLVDDIKDAKYFPNQNLALDKIDELRSYGWDIDLGAPVHYWKQGWMIIPNSSSNFGYDGSFVDRFRRTNESIIKRKINENPLGTENVLNDKFYELISDEFIYDTDSEGYNMSYGEYVEVQDILLDAVENELDYLNNPIEKIYKLKEIVDNADDDAIMFAGVQDIADDLYIDYDKENNTLDIGGIETLPKDLVEELKDYVSDYGIETSPYVRW